MTDIYSVSKRTHCEYKYVELSSFYWHRTYLQLLHVVIPVGLELRRSTEYLSIVAIVFITGKMLHLRCRTVGFSG